MDFYGVSSYTFTSNEIGEAMLTGLYAVHLELTSFCNKNCWMCGRRKIDKDFPDIKMNYGNMPLDLVYKIAKQLPDGMVVQFHNNGEPFMYPHLEDALMAFKGKIRCLDTNGKLLVKHADKVIHRLESLTISVIENDPEADKQYDNVVKFLELKGDNKPIMVYRLLGDPSKYYVEDKYCYDYSRTQRWLDLPGVIARRTLHSPMGSHTYKKTPTIPEIGMCVEILNHMAINRFGEVSPCVRFDPLRKGVIGNVNTETLDEIWNGHKRQSWVKLHTQGKRKDIDFCSKCQFWGVPTG